MVKRGKVLINVNDIIGKRLGKLEVISYAGHHYDMTLGGERMRHYYRVECECGTIKIVQRGPLKNEIIHSCGCGRKRNAKISQKPIKQDFSKQCNMNDDDIRNNCWNCIYFCFPIGCMLGEE